MLRNAVADPAANSDTKRIRGLDTLRFFLALWVVLRHFGFIPIHFNEAHLAGKLASGVIANLFCGPAAVVVFFVISGFCIHYPYRSGRKLLLVPYFARRHLRIWTPIIVALLLAKPVGVKFDFLNESILWSLLAEEIYYVIYPALLALRHRFAWRPMLIASYLAAVAVILTNPRAGNYPSYGPYLNGILGLPCWLLGCLLAEKLTTIFQANRISALEIWKWRMGMWALSSFCSALRFHSPLGFPWTLTLFAPVTYVWLQKELLYYRDHAPLRLFESAGKGSYSIYLMHAIAAAFFLSLSLSLRPTAQWCALLAFTLVLCGVFYFIVEKPSHALARKLANRLAMWNRVDAPTPLAPEITPAASPSV